MGRLALERICAAALVRFFFLLSAEGEFPQLPQALGGPCKVATPQKKPDPNSPAQVVNDLPDHVAFQDVGHLMPEDARHFLGRVGLIQKTRQDHHRSSRQGHGVHFLIFDDVKLEGIARIVGDGRF